MATSSDNHCFIVLGKFALPTPHYHHILLSGGWRSHYDILLSGGCGGPTILISYYLEVAKVPLSSYLIIWRLRRSQCRHILLTGGLWTSHYHHILLPGGCGGFNVIISYYLEVAEVPLSSYLIIWRLRMSLYHHILLSGGCRGPSVIISYYLEVAEVPLSSYLII